MEIFAIIFEWLKEVDKSIVLTINSWNSPLMDEIMWIVTGKFTWFPIYILLVFLVYKKLNIKHFILFCIIGFIAVGLADFISSSILKVNVARYRPTHNLMIGELLHLYEIKPNEFYRGGQYGFVSGHASNSFAIALFFGLFLKQYYKKIIILLVVWALIVSYSRIYLGVHYLSDIIGGMILGSLIAFCGNLAFRKVVNRQKEK